MHAGSAKGQHVHYIMTAVPVENTHAPKHMLLLYVSYIPLVVETVVGVSLIIQLTLLLKAWVQCMLITE